MNESTNELYDELYELYDASINELCDELYDDHVMNYMIIMK